MPAQTLASDRVPGGHLENVLAEIQKLAGKRSVYGTPIPWVARPIFAQGIVEPLDYGLSFQLTIAKYAVPRGYTALICGVVFSYTGGAASPGDLAFTLDVDNEGQSNSGEGYTVKDYAAVPFQLGSFVGGPPWAVEITLDEGEVLRAKGYAVQNVAVGPGALLSAALMGFEWPAEGWEG
jgi:hypothetical protein